MFLGNRVAETLQASTIDQWEQVEEVMNSVDLGSQRETLEANAESKQIIGFA